MGGNSLNRRAFLLSTASFGGLLALVSGAGSAAAFEVEKVGPQSPLALEIKNHCSTDVYHDQIRTRLQNDLLYRTAAPGTLLTETAYCPICGCPIIATRYVQ
jgi:hypothetical protein